MADDITLDDFDSIFNDGQSEQVDEEAAYLDAADAAIQKQPQPQGPLAAQAAGEAMMIRGMPLEATEFHAAMMTGDAEAARQQAAQAHYDEEMVKVHEYIDSSILSGEVSPELVVNIAIAEQQRVQNRQQSPDAVQKAYMQQAAPNAAGSMKDEVAAHKQMLEVMQTLHASRGGLDTALDVVGSFLPFHTTKDFSDFVDLIQDDKDVSFIGGHDLETVAINFQSLNPATKAAIFPRLVELAKQASGTLIGDENIVQVEQMLGLFLGSTPDEEVAGVRNADIALSSLDVPMGAALKGVVGVSKLAKGEKLLVKTVLEQAGKTAAQTNNPVNLAAQAGDKAKAAEYAVAAAKDPAIAESMNIRQADAGRVGLLQPNMIDPKITEGMSAEMVQQIQKDSAEFGAFADSISTEGKFLRAGTLTTSERQLSKESFYSQLEKTKEDYLTQNMVLEDVQVRDTEAGFSYNLTWRRLDTSPMVSPAPNASVAEVGEVAVKAADEVPLSAEEAVAKAAADAPDSIVVAHSNITKTANAVIIEGEHEAVSAALKAAGLPTGAQNKVKGNSYTSLAPHLHDRVVAALADAGGVNKGAKGANASEAAMARAVDNQAAVQAEAQAATTGQPVADTTALKQAAATEIEAKSPQYLKETGEVVMTKDDYTGNYNLTVKSLEKGTLHSQVQSPTAWMKGEKATEDGIRAATDEIVAKEVEAGITAHVTAMLQRAFAPVAGLKGFKSRQRLAAVLEHGDTFVNPSSAERGRTFTVQELADGFDIPGQKGRVRLTSPEEVTAYYRVRMFEDAMYQVENHAMRRRLQLEGMQQIKSLAGTHLGKVYSPASARALIEHNPGSVFFKADSGELVEARLDDLQKHLDDGYQVVRTRDPVNTSGTADGDETALYTDFLLVKKQGIKDLPAQVLNYREGYVTKINKAQYMVKRVYNVNQPGSPGKTGTMAVRGFNSLKDAETFRYEQITKYLQDNPKATYEQAKAKFTIGGADEEGAFAATERGSGRTGGLFTGMRSKNDLIFGLSGSDMKRVGLQDTLMRQTAHIGKLVARNELRLRNETVWLNTVKEQLPDVRIVGFEGTKLPSNSTGKALERIRDQIRQWNGVPDVDETKMQAAIQYLHDWALTGVRKVGMNKDSIDSLLWLKHSNPVTAVKTAMMHTLLGCMAPVQMYVQGSAALVAAGRRAGISLTGDVGGDIKVAMQFAMLDNIQHEGALGRVMNTLISKNEINPLVAEAYQAWNRTGLREGATANPDLAKIASDGLGITNGVLSNLSNMSLYFYRTGELFNRRYSFIKEFAAWKKINPGKVAGEEDIIGILKEANKNMLELNAANRAWWQGGAGTGMVRQILGMATQFLQVNAKMAELLLPQQLTGRAATAGFSTAQKGRIVASQMALFGSAGIPLGNAAIGQIFNIMGVDSMPPEAALAVNQGFVGFTVNAMLGISDDPTQQIDISQRAAIGNQVNQFLQDVYTSDDPLWLKMLGPAGGSAGSRFLQAARDARVFYLGNKAAEIEGVNGETLLGVISTYGSVLATMPSATSNLLKAYYMHNFDKILARNRKTVDARKYDFATEMAVAFGFTPSIESTTRAIEATNRNYEELVGAQAEMYIRVLHRAVFEQKMKPESVDHLIKVLAAQDAISDNPVMHYDIMQRVGTRLFSEPQSAHDRALSQYFKHDVVGHASQEAIADINGVIPQSAVVQPYYQKAQEK